MVKRAIIRLSGTQHTTDATVKIELPQYAGIKPDYSNIRFVDTKGQILPHWVEWWKEDGNGNKFATGNIWVKLPAIDETGTTLYVEWGDWNNGWGDGKTTFWKYNDVEYINEWVLASDTSISVTNENGVIRFSETATAADLDDAEWILDLQSNKYKFHMLTANKIYHPSSIGIQERKLVNEANNYFLGIYFGSSDDSDSLQIRHDSASWDDAVNPYTLNRLYFITTEVNGTTIYITVEDKNSVLWQKNTTSYNNNDTTLYKLVISDGTSSAIQIDELIAWVFVRKYLDPEPQVLSIQPIFSAKYFPLLFVSGTLKKIFLQATYKIGISELVYPETQAKTGQTESKQIETQNKTGLSETSTSSVQNKVGQAKENRIETEEKVGTKETGHVETQESIGEAVSVGNTQVEDAIGTAVKNLIETLISLGEGINDPVGTMVKTGESESEMLDTVARIGILHLNYADTENKVAKGYWIFIQGQESVAEKYRTLIQTINVVGEQGILQTIELQNLLSGIEAYKTLYRIMDYAKNRVEFGGTISIEYTTQRLNEEGVWEDVEADEVEAWIETAQTTPQKIQQITAKKNGAKVLVNFYADPSVVQSGKAYYISLYWKRYGWQEVERVLIVVVPDVK